MDKALEAHIKIIGPATSQIIKKLDNIFGDTGKNFQQKTWPAVFHCRNLRILRGESTVSLIIGYSNSQGGSPCSSWFTSNHVQNGVSRSHVERRAIDDRYAPWGGRLVGTWQKCLVCYISAQLCVCILVGGWPTPLKNMSSSVGMMTFPIYGKIKFMFQTTNQ